MLILHPSPLARLVETQVGTRRRDDLFRTLSVPSPLLSERDRDGITRAEVAMALAMLLFEDVRRRVPVAEAYAAEATRDRRLVLDHGALRTVAAPSGELPSGRTSIARVLRPLGYREVGIYPLNGLGMTGFAYAHEEMPAEVPQYFVSELHPERFSKPFQVAVQRVIGTSRDPLSPMVIALLGRLEREGSLGMADAARLLPALVAAFDRHHDAPSLADYEALLAESPEMAWIATEGHAFNHATDRVDDVRATAAEQRRLGRPIKDELEISASGRVLQTAFRAAEVERVFVAPDGTHVQRRVPGSFHELITRLPNDSGELDLTFDAGNAQGIFTMTQARDRAS